MTFNDGISAALSRTAVVMPSIICITASRVESIAVFICVMREVRPLMLSR